MVLNNAKNWCRASVHKSLADEKGDLFGDLQRPKSIVSTFYSQKIMERRLENLRGRMDKVARKRDGWGGMG